MRFVALFLLCASCASVVQTPGKGGRSGIVEYGGPMETRDAAMDEMKEMCGRSCWPEITESPWEGSYFFKCVCE